MKLEDFRNRIREQAELRVQDEGGELVSRQAKAVLEVLTVALWSMGNQLDAANARISELEEDITCLAV